jgi:hypothetical protein
MAHAVGGEFRGDVGGRSGHLFDHSAADSRKIDRLAA